MALQHAQTHPPGGDFQGPEGRSALARMIMKLFDLWQLSTIEQAELLGLSSQSRSTLSRYRNGAPFADNRDLLDRAGHILGIHKALRILFPHNRDLAYHWINTPNQRFQGKTPVEIIRENGFMGIVMVRRYLDFERGR